MSFDVLFLNWRKQLHFQLVILLPFCDGTAPKILEDLARVGESCTPNLFLKLERGSRADYEIAAPTQLQRLNPSMHLGHLQRLRFQIRMAHLVNLSGLYLQYGNKNFK